jgi:hypothetical protein
MKSVAVYKWVMESALQGKEPCLDAVTNPV